MPSVLSIEWQGQNYISQPLPFSVYIIMGQYRNYSDEDVIRYAKEVRSVSQLLGKLGLVKAGGNFNHMKYTLQRLNIDCSHWTGMAWSKDQQLKDWSNYTKGHSIKKHLINKRGHKCEDCQNSYWKEVPIPLEIHHIDGDRTNNQYENLSLLCCNCHALTDNWRARNIKKVVHEGFEPVT